MQPFTNEALRLVDVASPARTARLSLHVYELADSLAELSVWTTPDDVDAEGRSLALAGATAQYVEKGADALRVSVAAPRKAYLILRRADAAGWSATVNGEPAGLLAWARRCPIDGAVVSS